MALKGINKRTLKQTALYWGNPTPDGFGGYTFDTPIEIKCRWENQQELFINVDGEEQHSEAVVYVDRALGVEGFLMLGDFNDLSSSLSETPYDSSLDAYQIKAKKGIKNLKINITVRKVWLGEDRG